MVAEDRRAWHAGTSSWAGETDINSCSIGIEIANPGHDHNYPEFPRRQVAAVTALCRSIFTRHKIPADRVLAHSDVAPGRKIDPGEKFPWERLYRAGIGLCVAPAPPAPPALALGDRGEAVTDLQNALARYGFGITPTGIYDEATVGIVTAFQRHFRRTLVDGRADRSTIDALEALLAARDGEGVARRKVVARR
jgi:N-acetylmuramoyl-L-alanine amidase